MKSTDHPRPPLRSDTLQDRFEALRAAYYVRLTSDRSRLMALRMSMERAPPLDSSLYEEVQRVAHGMAGAAAVFEATQVAFVARRLEEIALAASRAPGSEADAAVLGALDALVDLLLTVSA
jgi:HPt (histidine-containing phosphotransfer) domain-containing protein